MSNISLSVLWSDFSKKWNVSKAVCVFNFATFALAVSMVLASPRSELPVITPVLSILTVYSGGYSGLVAAIALIAEAIRNFFFRKRADRSWRLFWWHVGYAATYAAFIGYIIFQILSGTPAEMVP